MYCKAGVLCTNPEIYGDIKRGRRLAPSKGITCPRCQGKCCNEACMEKHKCKQRARQNANAGGGGRVSHPRAWPADYGGFDLSGGQLGITDPNMLAALSGMRGAGGLLLPQQMGQQGYQGLMVGPDGNMMPLIPVLPLPLMFNPGLGQGIEGMTAADLQAALAAMQGGGAAAMAGGSAPMMLAPLPSGDGATPTAAAAAAANASQALQFAQLQSLSASGQLPTLLQLSVQPDGSGGLVQANGARLQLPAGLGMPLQLQGGLQILGAEGLGGAAMQLDAATMQAMGIVLPDGAGDGAAADGGAPGGGGAAGGLPLMPGLSAMGANLLDSSALAAAAAAAAAEQAGAEAGGMAVDGDPGGDGGAADGAALAAAQAAGVDAAALQSALDAAAGVGLAAAAAAGGGAPDAGAAAAELGGEAGAAGAGAAPGEPAPGLAPAGGAAGAGADAGGGGGGGASSLPAIAPLNMSPAIAEALKAQLGGFGGGAEEGAAAAALMSMVATDKKQKAEEAAAQAQAAAAAAQAGIISAAAAQQALETAQRLAQEVAADEAGGAAGAAGDGALQQAAAALAAAQGGAAEQLQQQLLAQAQAQAAALQQQATAALEQQGAADEHKPAPQLLDDAAAPPQPQQEQLQEQPDAGQQQQQQPEGDGAPQERLGSGRAASSSASCAWRAGVARRAPGRPARRRVAARSAPSEPSRWPVGGLDGGARDSAPIRPLAGEQLDAAVKTRFIAETLLPTRHGAFRLRGYKHSLDGGVTFTEPTAIIMGDVEGQEDVPVRVHDACFTSEVLGSLKCDCAEQLELALSYIQGAGRGMVIYLQQEGRGIGLANKIAAYALQEQGLDTVDANRALGLPDDCREYTSVRNILRDLRIRSVRLMTNNPRKLDVLTQLGVAISGRIPCQVQAGEHNQGYLTAKRERMDHLLDGSWCYWEHGGEPIQPSAAALSEGGMGLPSDIAQAQGAAGGLVMHTVALDEDADDAAAVASSGSSGSSSSSSGGGGGSSGSSSATAAALASASGGGVGEG
ncbi:ribBA [Scenedesmus sp. PABB004]|nr:ribBA [Scenedesmus sp. PABB004]